MPCGGWGVELAKNRFTYYKGKFLYEKYLIYLLNEFYEIYFLLFQ